jgi:hypothetical protein
MPVAAIQICNRVRNPAMNIAFGICPASLPDERFRFSFTGLQINGTANALIRNLRESWVLLNQDEQGR